MEYRNLVVVFIAVFCIFTSSYSSASPTLPDSQTPQFSFLLENNFTLEKTPEIDRETYRFIRLAQIEEEFEDPFVEELDDDLEDFFEETETISDPLKGFNRAMFTFNDRFYHWLLKPVSRGYGFIFPKRVRISVRNFFVNAEMPVRVVNCLLQGRTRDMGIELSRFIVNTTVGIVGLFNPASSLCNLEPQEADFDQTLGIYGMSQVFYLHWPLFGASSVRGTLGLFGDMFMRPTTYLVDFPIMVGVRAYELVNETSLTIGDYEGLTEPALDPYIAVRNFYFQNRREFVLEPSRRRQENQPEEE
ncbi:MAG: VacJ family lipoprotein [Thermodesulfobacteriota bacterium]|nr:VacJ family lipoprotein [Thermodesulfobacteriota bacterium]